KFTVGTASILVGTL
ncbi:YSIRK-type signal peptide-containing protein, partial [Staphylococcus haemolyticus]